MVGPLCKIIECSELVSIGSGSLHRRFDRGGTIQPLNMHEVADASTKEANI